MLAIRGFSSRLAQAVIDLLPKGESAVQVSRNDRQTTAQRHLFCQGVLYSMPMGAQSPEAIAASFMANAVKTVTECDCIIASNDEARICVIGSESAFTWSHDGTYAASKAAVHRYVETKKLRTPRQQLVCIAPGIIDDAMMTIRRNDLDRLEARMKAHPKERFLTCSEVARWVHFCLYVDAGFMTNQVLRLNGGEHL